MSFLYFCKGGAEFKVRIDNPEMIVNKLRHEIAISDIYISSDVLSFSCFYSQRKKVYEIIEKYNCEKLSVKLKGLPFVFSKYKKRAGLFFGALFMSVCIFASSFFVWDISVEGNENVPGEEILRELERAGFCIGMLKKNVDIERCVNMLLVNEDRLSWAAINFDGTLAHVEVKEAKIGKKQEVKENVNLVASHNGIIIRADALDGKSVVEKGESVIKGQLLVSAFMDKRTGGSVLTGARGYVWANTERCYTIVVPLDFHEKKLTGRFGIKYAFSVLGKTVVLPYIGKNNFDKSNEVVEKVSVCFGDNFRLPLKVTTAKTSEYECVEKKRTESQALELARSMAEMRLSEDSIGFTIADIDEKFYYEDERLVYTCIFDGVENIAKELEFELS